MQPRVFDMNHSASAKFQSGQLNSNIPESHTEAGLIALRKKRKRESIDSSSVSRQFEAKVISVNQPLKVSTASLFPIETILRAHLPLAWLSNESKCDTLHPGVYIQADIQSVSRWDYSILVAEHSRNGNLYALERVDLGVFVCFPLRECVTVEWIKQAAIGATPHYDLEVLQPTSHRAHRRTASVASTSNFRGIKDEPVSPKAPQNRRGMLARQSILSRHTNEGESIDGSWTTQPAVQDPIEAEPAEESEISTNTTREDSLDKKPESMALQNEFAVISNESGNHTEDIVQGLATPLNEEVIYVDQLSPDYLRKRYLEMLYLSRTSLAFYAKGPLSRTRARARADGASMDLDSLAIFYRGSILPVKKLDLKYKQSLQDRIKSLNMIDTIGNFDEAKSDSVLPHPNAKKTRRTKLSKDGLWPIEDEFIEKWWCNREKAHSSAGMSNTLQAELERKVPQLRMRETELQIILILEVLALEAQKKSKEANDSADQAQEVESGEVKITARPPSPSPAKKKRDLRVDLEVLLDKLCILHSIGVDDLAVGPMDDVSERRTSNTAIRDDLKDFCKDVVIPFYSSKLPEECKSICQKLGGLETSPERHKPRAKIPPGTAIASRIAPSQSKRTLDRVLSEESVTRSVQPTISRSSTLPPSATLKREPSERPMSRGGVPKSASFNNREIDLVADAQATAAKRRKLDRIAAQKRELEAAIDALKRPNRSAAAKTFMDDVERRSTDSKVPSRKNDPVQIIATPKISRTRSVPADEYELPPMVRLDTRSEMAVVPSSTSKPRGLNHISSIARSSAKKRAVLSAIHDTPLRDRDAKRVRADPETEGDAGNIAELPNQSSSTLVNSTPAPSRLRAGLIQSVLSTPVPGEKDRRGGLFTPTKPSQTNVEDVFRDVPELRHRANQMMDRAMNAGKGLGDVSIYDSLGWNDDVDDYDI